MTSNDNCPNCGHGYDDDDARTDEQITADIAATTLARLAHLDEEHHQLHHQLVELAEWVGDPDGPDGEYPDIFLFDVAASLRLNHLLFNTVAECVRDIAAKLPVRGIDYGTN
jgi:hypothetical protein